MNYRVTKVSETDGLDANGRLQKMIVVTYTVGEHGPFTAQFTKDEFAAGAVQGKLNEFAQNLLLLPGVNL
jgi:hypothetical protein